MGIRTCGGERSPRYIRPRRILAGCAVNDQFDPAGGGACPRRCRGWQKVLAPQSLVTAATTEPIVLPCVHFSLFNWQNSLPTRPNCSDLDAPLGQFFNLPNL